MNRVRPFSGGHALSAEVPFILKKAVPSAPAATQTVDNEHLLHGVFSTAASFTPMVDEQQPLAHEFF